MFRTFSPFFISLYFFFLNPLTYRSVYWFFFFSVASATDGGDAVVCLFIFVPSIIISPAMRKYYQQE